MKFPKAKNKMEKEFVPYELALRLKNLGFDEPCFGMYCEGKFHLLYPNSYKDIPEDFYREVDAPTFSQAFRWLRANHDLDYNIYPYMEMYKRYYLAKIYMKLCEKELLNDEKSNFRFNNYEEAEIACLEKLIEIVEQKID